jgi:hypothetical protein
MKKIRNFENYEISTNSKIGLFNIKSFDEVPTTIENYRLLNQLKIRYENTRSE